MRWLSSAKFRLVDAATLSGSTVTSLGRGDNQARRGQYGYAGSRRPATAPAHKNPHRHLA